MNGDSPHDQQYFPPIPTLTLDLGIPDGMQLQRLLSAPIDTGADITIMPLSLLEEIEAPELDEVRLRSHWGEPSTFITYLVDIHLSIGTLPGIEVVGDPQGTEILLGRNVLNMLLLLIDGPNLLTSILLERPTKRE